MSVSIRSDDRFEVDHELLHLGGSGALGWGNLGDFSATEDYATAAAALARRIAIAAGVGPGSRVIDAGCGWGEQALLMADELGAAEVRAVDVSQRNVERARQRVTERGLQQRIVVVRGDAADLGFAADASVDAVVAVDSAYHFDTRARFLAEACRVLRPGGRVAFSDLVLAQPPGSVMSRALWRGLARRLDVPPDNLVDGESCLREMVAAGLSPDPPCWLTRPVLGGFSRFAFHHARRHLLRNLRHGWAKILLSALGAYVCDRGGHVRYVMFSAEKPKPSGQLSPS